MARKKNYNLDVIEESVVEIASVEAVQPDVENSVAEQPVESKAEGRADSCNEILVTNNTIISPTLGCKELPNILYTGTTVKLSDSDGVGNQSLPVIHVCENTFNLMLQLIDSKYPPKGLKKVS